MHAAQLEGEQMGRFQDGGRTEGARAASVGRYYDFETKRIRWAVCFGGVWYLPQRYGRAAAERLARRIAREVTP